MEWCRIKKVPVYDVQIVNNNRKDIFAAYTNRGQFVFVVMDNNNQIIKNIHPFNKINFKSISHDKIMLNRWYADSLINA
jgi:hypothetical protein